MNKHARENRKHLAAIIRPNEVQALSDQLREWFGEQMTSPQLFDLIVKHLKPWQLNTLADQLREHAWAQQIGRRERPA